MALYQARTISFDVPHFGAECGFLCLPSDMIAAALPVDAAVKSLNQDVVNAGTAVPTDTAQSWALFYSQWLEFTGQDPSSPGTSGWLFGHDLGDWFTASAVSMSAINDQATQLNTWRQTLSQWITPSGPALPTPGSLTFWQSIALLAVLGALGIAAVIVVPKLGKSGAAPVAGLRRRFGAPAHSGTIPTGALILGGGAVAAYFLMKGTGAPVTAVAPAPAVASAATSPDGLISLAPPAPAIAPTQPTAVPLTAVPLTEAPDLVVSQLAAAGLTPGLLTTRAPPSPAYVPGDYLVTASGGWPAVQALANMGTPPASITAMGGMGYLLHFTNDPGQSIILTARIAGIDSIGLNYVYHTA